MSSNLLSTALSGLVAFQRSLDTTSHNIANVNTEGYSRQRAELATKPAEFIGSGFLGKGVDVENITRVYDQFVNNQLRSSASAFGEVDKFHQLSAQIDNIIADDSIGISPALNSFFNAVNDVADDPTSIPARQVMLSETEFLVHNFNNIGGRFGDANDRVNADLAAIVDEINAIASSIAELNISIVADVGRASGRQEPNDLLDQRDLLLLQLAEKIDVAVLDQEDGSVSVFIGQGQALVLGPVVTKLSLENSAIDPSLKEIHMNGQDISRHLSGGELTGVLRFRDEVLGSVQQQLGLLVAGLAIEFNGLHNTGFDLNGVAGADLFSFGTPEIPVVDLVSAAGGTVTATFKSSAENLEASDYRVDFSSPTAFTITRLSDNSTVLPIDVGFDLALVGTLTAGDQFFVRPTFQVAKNISSQITDPKAIAASQTVSTLPGDNRIALELAGLRTAPLLSGGSASFSQVYEQFVGSVATATQSARISRSAQEALYNQARGARENVSGVNLDEEAANLIKFQNSYQAAAQAINISRTIFDTLLGAVQ